MGRGAWGEQSSVDRKQIWRLWLGWIEESGERTEDGNSSEILYVFGTESSSLARIFSKLFCLTSFKT